MNHKFKIIFFICIKYWRNICCVTGVCEAMFLSLSGNTIFTILKWKLAWQHVFHEISGFFYRFRRFVIVERASETYHLSLDTWDNKKWFPDFMIFSRVPHVCCIHIFSRKKSWICGVELSRTTFVLFYYSELTQRESREYIPSTAETKRNGIVRGSYWENGKASNREKGKVEDRGREESERNGKERNEKGRFARGREKR